MPSIEIAPRQTSPSSPESMPEVSSYIIVLVPAFLIVACFLLVLVLVMRCCRQSNKRRALHDEEDKWFKDPKYVEDRLDWLHEAITDLSSRLNGKSAEMSNEGPENGMSVKLNEVHERYVAVEDMVKRYGTWQIRTKREIKIVDWDEFGIAERGRDIVARLRNALSGREVFLVAAEAAWGTMEFLNTESVRIEEGKKFFEAEERGYMYVVRDDMV